MTIVNPRSATVQKDTYPATPWSLAKDLSPTSPAHKLFMILTTARIGLLLPIVFFNDGLVPTIMLTLFILWDMADGSIARRYCSDFPQRRMLDAYVDRIGVLLVAWIFAASQVIWVSAALILTAIGLVTFFALDFAYKQAGVALMGGTPNRIAGLMTAAWAVSVFCNVARVKRAVNAHKKRRSTLEAASGYRGQRSRLYRKAKEQLLHSSTYQYRDRKARKGDFRKLWIARINAAVRANDMTYNRFIQGLRLAGVETDRKVLADLAVTDEVAFAALVEVARAAVQAEGIGGAAAQTPAA